MLTLQNYHINFKKKKTTFDKAIAPSSVIALLLKLRFKSLLF